MQKAAAWLLGAAVAAAADSNVQNANDVDCAFRKLGMEVASRNLGGDNTKLAAVANGLNVSQCPSGDSWVSAFSRDAGTLANRHIKRTASTQIFVDVTGNDNNPGERTLYLCDGGTSGC